MTEIVLNVYDVTNTQSDATNDSIVRLNNLTRPLGLGGVFHGGVELNNQEWSFGYCERGTGVYSCRPKGNPMYSYRETIELGKTNKSHAEIKDVLRRLRHEWSGASYDLLSRNCCHFCEVLCKELEVKAPPGWVNRFAVGADATVTFTNEAVSTLKNWGMTIQSTTTTSFNWMRETWVRAVQTPTPPSTPPSDPTKEPGFSPLMQQKPSWSSWQTVTPQPRSSAGNNEAIPAAHPIYSQPSSSFSSVAPVTGVMTEDTTIADSEVSLLGPEIPMTTCSSNNSFASIEGIQLSTLYGSKAALESSRSALDSSTSAVSQCQGDRLAGLLTISSDKPDVVSACGDDGATDAFKYRRMTTTIPDGEQLLMLISGEDTTIL